MYSAGKELTALFTISEFHSLCLHLIRLSDKVRMSTTATVQFAVNCVPQCFYVNAPYTVLSRFTIIKSLGH